MAHRGWSGKTITQLSDLSQGRTQSSGQEPGGGEGGDDGDLVSSSPVPAPTVIKFCRLKRDVVKYIQHGYRFIIVILSFTAGLGRTGWLWLGTILYRTQNILMSLRLFTKTNKILKCKMKCENFLVKVGGPRREAG